MTVLAFRPSECFDKAAMERLLAEAVTQSFANLVESFDSAAFHTALENATLTEVLESHRGDHRAGWHARQLRPYLLNALTQSDLFRQLPEPWRVTPEDVTETAAYTLSVHPSDLAEGHFIRFWSLLDALAEDDFLRTRSATIRLDFPLPDHPESPGEQAPGPWDARHHLTFVSGLGLRAESKGHGDSVVRIYGSMTERAVQRISSGLFPQAIRSIFRTVATTQGCSPSDEPQEGVDFWDGVRRCLTAYFAPPGNQKPVHRRIRNALRLLVYADLSEGEVQLALSVSAIEAVLCSKASGITEQFGSRLVGLLQPDPLQRSATLKVARNLYDSRSKLLHGVRVEHESVGSGTEAAWARLLASAVLRAALEWTRGAEHSRSQEFHNAIDQAFANGHPLEHIPSHLTSFLDPDGRW